MPDRRRRRNAAAAAAEEEPHAEPAEPALPPSDMTLDPARAALVVTDPQIKLLSPRGVTWGVVGGDANVRYMTDAVWITHEAVGQITGG